MKLLFTILLFHILFSALSRVADSLPTKANIKAGAQVKLEKRLFPALMPILSSIGSFGSSALPVVAQAGGAIGLGGILSGGNSGATTVAKSGQPLTASSFDEAEILPPPSARKFDIPLISGTAITASSKKKPSNEILGENDRVSPPTTPGTISRVGEPDQNNETELNE